MEKELCQKRLHTPKLVQKHGRLGLMAGHKM